VGVANAAVFRWVADHSRGACTGSGAGSISGQSNSIPFFPAQAPFGPEIVSDDKAYYFVCPNGHEAQPKVRASRD
jgi:hypothetical protein